MQLNQAEIIQQNQQKYLISGTVDFSTVPDLIQRAVDFIKSHKKSADITVVNPDVIKADTSITMDLSKITFCNSAGLALMLEMSKQARSENIELHFENLPETLLIIAKAYGVEEQIIAPPSMALCAIIANMTVHPWT